MKFQFSRSAGTVSASRSWWRLRRSDAIRIPLALVLAFGAVAVGHTPAVDAADPPVTLTLKGSHMMDPLVSAWDTDLFNLNGSVQIEPFKSNSLLGRQSVIEGDIDVALSAVSFTADDNARIAELTAAGQKPDFVTIPVSASALLFAELTPKRALIVPGTAITDLVDMPPGPAIGYTTAQAMRLYMEHPNLYDEEYAALHGYTIYDGGENGDAPARPTDMIPAVGFEQLEIAARTGPSAMGWMMERMMKERAPELWQRYLTRIKRPNDTLSEQIDIPFSFNGSEPARWAVKSYEPMMEAMLAFAVQGSRPCCVFAGMPPWVMQQYRYHALDLQGLPRTEQASLDKWELRPLKIDGVDPTPETIAKALADGDGLSSTDAKIPDMHGGYPASFIHKMIVRTDTLKPERVNAMVDLIIYAVTAGQEKAVPLGDPTLPRFHVLRALGSANEIVTKSCPTGRVIDGSPVALAAADGAAAVSVPMKRCAPPPAPTTTTSTTTTTTTTFENQAGASTSTSTTATTRAASPSSSGFSNPSPNVVIANNTPRSATVSVPPVTASVPVETTTTTTAAAAEIDPDSLSGAELVAYYDVAEVPPPNRRRSPALQPLLGAAAFAVGASRGGRQRSSWSVNPEPGR